MFEEFKNILDEDIYITVSKNIKRYRIKRNMTQKELADKCLFSHEFIRQIESKKGKKNFSLGTVKIIVNALDIPITSLFEIVL